MQGVRKCLLIFKLLDLMGPLPFLAGEILRAREPQEQLGLWVPFAHGHPSFRRSRAPGAPSKNMVINSTLDESVMPSAASR